MSQTSSRQHTFSLSGTPTDIEHAVLTVQECTKRYGYPPTLSSLGKFGGEMDFRWALRGDGSARNSMSARLESAVRSSQMPEKESILASIGSLNASSVTSGQPIPYGKELGADEPIQHLDIDLSKE